MPVLQVLRRIMTNGIFERNGVLESVERGYSHLLCGPRLFGLMKGVFAQERKKLRLFPALRRNVIQ